MKNEPTENGITIDKIKRRNFILQCVAWGLAVVLLLTVILVVNLTGRRHKEGAVDDFTVNLIDSSEQFNLYDHDGEVVIIVFWDSASQESLTLMREFAAQKKQYARYAKNTFLAIHPSENIASARNAIASEGWRESGVLFARDDEENGVFALFEGTDRPMTVYLNYSLALVGKENGVPAEGELKTKINTAFLGGEEGYFCPDFTLNDFLDNPPFAIGEQRGKVTVINFWTTYCTPCVNEMPEFEGIHQKYGGAVNVVAVHGSRETGEDIPAFIKSHGWGDFHVRFLREADSGIYDAIDGRASWPMTVVVDGNGFIVHKRLGSIELPTQEQRPHYDNVLRAIDTALENL